MGRHTEFYFRLGVGPDATLKEINDAYVRKTEELKPDKNPESESAEVRLKLVCEAYEVLCDKERRKIYDRYGEKGLKTGCEDGKEKGEGGDKKDEVRNDSFVLDEEHRKLFAQYTEAKEIPPPDRSFSDRDNIQEYQVFKVMNTIPTKGSMRTFRYVTFKVCPWDVSKLVHQWVESWYRVPGDFAKSAVIPQRFARVFVPFFVFDVKLTMLICGTETYVPPENKQDQTEDDQHLYSLYQPLGPSTKKTVHLETTSDDYVECSAASSRDRNFYDEWSDQSIVWSCKGFYPDTEFGLLAPLNQCDAVELEHMCDLARAEQEKQKMGFFQSLWSTVKSVFVSENIGYQGPPSDAYVLPLLSEDDVWKMNRDRIKKRLIDKCIREWKKKAETNYHRTVDSHSMEDFSTTATLIFLPVYSGTYTYGDTRYRVAVNGVNGEVIGGAPDGTFGGFFSNLFRHMGFG